MTVLKHKSDVNLNFHSTSEFTKKHFSASKRAFHFVKSVVKKRAFHFVKSVVKKNFLGASLPDSHSYRHSASVSWKPVSAPDNPESTVFIAFKMTNIASGDQEIVNSLIGNNNKKVNAKFITFYKTYSGLGLLISKAQAGIANDGSSSIKPDLKFPSSK